MGRILFIQLNEYELHGIEALAGELKNKGHQVEVLVAFFEKKPLWRIKKFSPHLIGFSLVSVEREEALLWAKTIKSKFNLPIILSLIHI